MTDSKKSAKAASGGKGLEEVVAGKSAISLIEGEKGRLYYRGYTIEELTQFSTFEEVAFLLHHGELPPAVSWESFKKDLSSRRQVPRGLLDILKNIPPGVPPMAVLRTLVSHLALYSNRAESKSPQDNQQIAWDLIAQTGTLVAAFHRTRQGLEPIDPDPALGYAANFLYMLTGKKPQEIEARVLDQYLILLAEHSFNASTFAGRVCVSTLSDVYSAVVAAIGTLKGDLHGSANSRTMEMLAQVKTVEAVIPYVEKALAEKKKIMGFGHRVYKTTDPRAQILKEMARELAKGRPDRHWFEISEFMEKIVWDRKQLYCNVDFYSAYVLYSIGIPTDLFTTIFAMSRMSGWTAHILEQLNDNRLIRPSAQYIGEKGLAYRSLDTRDKKISILQFMVDGVKKFFK